MTAEELCEQAKRFTDTPGWSSSWHWPRNQGFANTETVKAAMADLRCGDMDAEIADGVQRIKARYLLRDMMLNYIGREE